MDNGDPWTIWPPETSASITPSSVAADTHRRRHEPNMTATLDEPWPPWSPPELPPEPPRPPSCPAPGPAPGPTPGPAPGPGPAPASVISIHRLPPELRLKIWSFVTEPRVVLLGDLIQNPRSYPLPVVAQINAETRAETRRGYEPAGRGSYLHFSRDILVCDHQFADQTSSNLGAEALAPRVERVVFWDCTPDEERIRLPDLYSEYLSLCYNQKCFGQVVFDRFWFPNVKEFWSVKVGEVDRSWMVHTDRSAPFETRLQQTAREFRYWVDESIIEIAPLDLGDSDARAILRQGRCSRENCHELNAGRIHIVSKVNFLDGKYEEPPADGRTWVRVVPSRDGARSEGPTSRAAINRMRWTLVERSLTFFLRYDWPDGSEGAARVRQRSR